MAHGTGCAGSDPRKPQRGVSCCRTARGRTAARFRAARRPHARARRGSVGGGGAVDGAQRPRGGGDGPGRRRRRGGRHLHEHAPRVAEHGGRGGGRARVTDEARRGGAGDVELVGEGAPASRRTGTHSQACPGVARRGQEAWPGVVMPHLCGCALSALTRFAAHTARAPGSSSRPAAANAPLSVVWAEAARRCVGRVGGGL